MRLFGIGSGARHAVAGLALAAVALVGGCAGGEDVEGPDQAGKRPPAALPSSDSTVAPQPSGKAGAAFEYSVSVRAGKITPRTAEVSVRKGQQVKLTFTSDVTDTVHVHGYDKEAKLAPNTPVTVSFTADMTGSYEVETHETDKLLFKLVVTP